ncbi:NAD(P)-binding protein [Artomyces pyxidatus]|uniref:NAD(P)-binding protein n=1 Tax=Artomyces pyxidatus TaxID=48021 RepID=A0ACB8TA50_9AGAM|nr:NAD(P)-binding protein [Artomyces pyxidatus]
MEPIVQKLLVVGGNGFIGSAVCKAALSKGYQVTSISSSGRPFSTPKGHTPAWASKVEWLKGDALHPETYAHVLPSASAVVHTLGTLLPDTGYKDALRSGGFLGALGSVARGLAGGGDRNPLDENAKASGYEMLNRDSALQIAQAFLENAPGPSETGQPRAFVYISAEDIFRPFIPPAYIETKRKAEAGIERILGDSPNHRGVYMRPSLVYHPHFRPYTSPVAALLDLSSSIHARAPRGVPTPSSILRTLSAVFPTGTARESPVQSSPLESVANALTLPPIHVDHVAEAICLAADGQRTDVRGVYGVRDMRELIGWAMKGQDGQAHAGLGI